MGLRSWLGTTSHLCMDARFPFTTYPQTLQSLASLSIIWTLTIMVSPSITRNLDPRTHAWINFNDQLNNLIAALNLIGTLISFLT